MPFEKVLSKRVTRGYGFRTLYYCKECDEMLWRAATRKVPRCDCEYKKDAVDKDGIFYGAEIPNPRPVKKEYGQFYKKGDNFHCVDCHTVAFSWTISLGCLWLG